MPRSVGEKSLDVYCEPEQVKTTTSRSRTVGDGCVWGGGGVGGEAHHKKIKTSLKIKPKIIVAPGRRLNAHKIKFTNA